MPIAWTPITTGIIPVLSQLRVVAIKVAAHVLMGDGAVIFMTDSVEAGDATLPTVCVQRGGNSFPISSIPGSASNYGLWGALGTRDSQETIEEQLNQ